MTLNQNIISRQSLILRLGFVLLVTFLSFSSTLNNGWTNWDDTDHVLENSSVISADALNIFAHFKTHVLNQYIPLVTYSYAIEYFFFGDNPFIYHLTNLILHLAITALIFSFVCRLKLSAEIAFFSALLFGIHPIHVESVAWITERKDVLYAFFYMLSLCAYMKYINCQKKKREAFTMSLFWGLLSMLSKPMALSLPLICLLCDTFVGRKIDKSAVLEKALYFLYIIPIAAITYFMHSRVPGENFLSAILIWIWTATFYLEKFVLFWDLNPYYTFSEPVSLSNFVYAKAVLYCIVTLSLIFVWIKNRYVVFAFLFYFLSNFFMFKFDAGDVSVVADRYMYLPSVGFCILAGYGIVYGITNAKKNLRQITIGIVACLFVVLGIKTYQQVDVWASSQTLWSEVVKKSPDAAKGYANLGGALLEEGKYSEAIVLLNRAIAIDRQEYRALTNRGFAYSQLGELQKALDDYTRSLSINNELGETLNNRGNLYKHFKRFDLAIKDFDRAIALDVDDYRAFSNRGAVYGRLKEYDAAMQDFNQALVLKPDQAEIYHNRGLTYFAQRKFDQALADLTKSIDLKSDYAFAYFNRARVFLAVNHKEQALKDANKALKLNHPHAKHLIQFIKN